MSLHIVKWFQVFLTWIILYTIDHLFAHILMDINMICKWIVCK